MSDFTLSCVNQRKQRSKFFYHEAGDASSRFNIVSPYTYTASNQLIYSQNDLNMRRKAEILKYDTKDYNKNKKLNWAFLSRKVKKNIKCNSAYDSKPTSSSDVPGKIIQLVENDSIPLYNYKDGSKQFNYQNIPFDNFKRIFDSFPFYNISSLNGEFVNIMDIIILNPDNNQFSFNFSIPICIQFEADFEAYPSNNTGITSVQLATFSSILDVYYSDSLISTNTIEYRSTPELSSDIVSSTLSLSLDLVNSATGKIKISQYVGNIILNNVTIQTVTQYVYTILLKTNIGYAEYAGGQQDAYRTNDEGSDMNNTNSINLTNISYKFITNFDNSNPSDFDTYENCVLTMFNAEGNLLDSNSRVFQPYNLNATPI